MLDAALVEAGMSRLVIDCNRPLDAPDLIPQVSETTVIPGNAGADRSRSAPSASRCPGNPFTTPSRRCVDERVAAGRETWLVSIHSFTPVYKGVARPWQIGIIHDDDERLSAPLIGELEALKGFTVGDNEPYSPADRVYFTLERHARSRGLPCAMIEIRNDEIADEAGQAKWAELLGTIFQRLKPDRRDETVRRQRAGR